MNNDQDHSMKPTTLFDSIALVEQRIRDVERERDEFKTKLNTITSLDPTLTGHWHHGDGVLICGTVRVAREDFDSAPPRTFKKEFWDWVCNTMNAAQALRK